MPTKNVIVWFDIPTLDFERARRFYNEVLNEEIRVDESTGTKLGMFPMESGMGVGGDLVPPDPKLRPAENGSGQRVYFSVEGRIDDALARVEKAGGKIVQPKMWMEMAGWIAIIEDTEGNVVGLHSTGKNEG